MKSTTFLSILLATVSCANAAPTPKAAVTVQLYTVRPTGNLPTSQDQVPLASSDDLLSDDDSLSDDPLSDDTLSSEGPLLHLTVGQVLSFDHAPLHISAIEIASVHEGTDLSSPPRYVEEEDERVVCEAKIGYSSMGVRFTKGYWTGTGLVAVAVGDEGAERVVTGLECWLL
ncbi:hypothetical protein P280DRAFT_254789 [Massarina eburnea CBS 473.64]|uniref:Uncharacterized protein n=1 Tax=Massarina eburnea CBS 473.64 TaxID=1395130 RepID=A0A6A6SAS5_9PLEO|nr:hypothetical protein P280DRAFT_254789 [Massarina eburnea CBS 473.64]